MSGLFYRIQRTVPTLLLLLSLALAVPRTPVSSQTSFSPSSSSSLSSSQSYALLFFPDLKQLSSSASGPSLPPLPSSPSGKKITTSSSSDFSSTPSSSASFTPSPSSVPDHTFNEGNPGKDAKSAESVPNVSTSSDVMAVSTNGNEDSLSFSSSSSSSSSTPPPSSKAPHSTTEVRMTKRARFQLTASENEKKLLEAVENLFLKKVGLSKRPKIKDEYAVPEYMLDLYKNQVKGRGGHGTFLSLKGRGHIEANTVRSFVHEDIENNKCQPPLCARVHFDVSSVAETESLAAAELRIFLDTKQLYNPTSSRRADPADGAVSKSASRRPGDHDKYRVEVHEIMRPPFADGEVISRLLDTKSLNLLRNSTWQSFDIHPALARWKRGSEHNHGLEIRLVSNTPTLSTDNHIRVRRSVEMPVAQWAIQRPVLVAFTNDGSTPSSTSNSSKSRLRRSKRSGKNKRRNRKKNRKRRRKRKKGRRLKKGNKNMCRVHSLYVDFDDVGWDDWIVAPPGYQAGYCNGDCMAPLPIFTKASNHAMLQARVYATKPGSVPMVCCVPISMSTTSILYRNEKGRTVLKNYQDMTVDKCGCK